MTDNLNNTQILKLFVDLKKEMATYKEETTKKITSLENEIVDLNKIIDKQNKELLAKDNEINVLKITIENMKKDHKETVSIMAKEIRELKKENKQLKRIIKDKDREINNLNKRIDNLEKENQKLNNQKTKNSSNSSKPPSTDGFNKIVHSMRNKSDKNVGGQKLHQGTTLKKNKIEEIIKSNKDNVVVKEKTLYVNKKNLDGKTKYEVDTQLVVTITKYKLVYDKNAPELPKKLKNNVVYGSYLKSIVALLNIEHAVSVSRTVDIIRELTKGVINLSTGTILNIEYELKDKVQPSNSCIKDYLLRCEVNHKDETMVFCNGESRWFHTFGNKLATLYYYHKSRGNTADIEKGLLRIFTGTLVHDHMKGLYRFISDDAECNAHILRYLQFTIEQYNRKWAKDLKDLLLEIKKETEEEMKKGNNCLRAESILKYEIRYSEILDSGKEEFNNDSNPHKDYNGEDMKLLRRLNEYKDNHLAFMYDFRIPFDNNLAERDLRMIKAKKKISGCFRSDKGGEAYAEVKTYLSTMRKQKNNLYHSLISAFNNIPILIQ